MFRRSCSSESLNRYESVVFLVFPGKRPFKLCPSTSLRQFDWERSRYSSRDLALDPCQGIEDIRQSREHITTTCLGTCRVHVWYMGLHLSPKGVMMDYFLPSKRRRTKSGMTRNWRPDVHAPLLPPRLFSLSLSIFDNGSVSWLIFKIFADERKSQRGIRSSRAASCIL